MHTSVPRSRATGKGPSSERTFDVVAAVGAMVFRRPAAPAWHRALALACMLGCRVQDAPPPAPPAPAPAVASAPAVPSLKVGSVADAVITVDGKLDEPAWTRCGTTGALTSPHDGAPQPSSRVQAEVRVCASSSRLLVGAVVRDAAPVSPFQRDDVDPHLWEQSSAIEFMLQPGDPGDNREYFEVQVDVHGAVWDTRFDDYNQPVTAAPGGGRRYGHQDWDARLQRAVTVDATQGSYTVELALPWSALASSRTAIPPKPGDSWRANFYSFRDGQRDSLAWSPLRGQGNFHRSARFGRLVFDAFP